MPSGQIYRFDQYFHLYNYKMKLFLVFLFQKCGQSGYWMHWTCISIILGKKDLFSFSNILDFLLIFRNISYFCIYPPKRISLFFRIFTNDINFPLWDKIGTIFINKAQQIIFEYVNQYGHGDFLFYQIIGDHRINDIYFINF